MLFNKMKKRKMKKKLAQIYISAVCLANIFFLFTKLKLSYLVPNDNVVRNKYYNKKL